MDTSGPPRQKGQLWMLRKSIEFSPIMSELRSISAQAEASFVPTKEVPFFGNVPDSLS
jgi:hypothetical protein